ncbi:hypothetical protein V2G26_012259 [Clonostachys chloroleuca]
MNTKAENSTNLHADDSLAVGTSCASNDYERCPLHLASFVCLTPIQTTPSASIPTNPPSLFTDNQDTRIMAKDEIPVPSLKGNKMTLPNIIKLKVSTSNHKLAEIASSEGVNEVPYL